MSNNGRKTEHTRHIARIMHFVRNGEKCRMQNVDVCEGVLQLADIDTNNFGEHDLTIRMKYIMLRIDNWDRTLVQEGWENIGYSVEQELCMTRLYWVEESTQ